jgi:hypothetical protein
MTDGNPPRKKRWGMSKRNHSDHHLSDERGRTETDESEVWNVASQLLGVGNDILAAVLSAAFADSVWQRTFPVGSQVLGQSHQKPFYSTRWTISEHCTYDFQF